MNVLSEQVARVTIHATNCLARLDRLEEAMATIHDVLVKEDLVIHSTRDRIAGELWSKFGGNKETLRIHEMHIKLLSGVHSYRINALNHVVATMRTLEAIDADLSELRGKLSAPDALRIGEVIPLEVHLASIESSVRTLRTQLSTRHQESPPEIAINIRDAQSGGLTGLARVEEV